MTFDDILDDSSKDRLDNRQKSLDSLILIKYIEKNFTKFVKILLNPLLTLGPIKSLNKPLSIDTLKPARAYQSKQSHNLIVHGLRLNQYLAGKGGTAGPKLRGMEESLQETVEVAGCAHVEQPGRPSLHLINYMSDFITDLFHRRDKEIKELIVETMAGCMANEPSPSLEEVSQQLRNAFSLYH